MEIGRQIKKYRTELKLSQEELADKIYVTRQTVSNWENDKNYPDIHSLVLLSSLFGISLDDLVKGDVKEMEEEIKTEDAKKLKRDGWIYFMLLCVTVVSAVPLIVGLWPAGAVVWLAVWGITMLHAHSIEKKKKASVSEMGVCADCRSHSGCCYGRRSVDHEPDRNALSRQRKKENRCSWQPNRSEASVLFCHGIISAITGATTPMMNRMAAISEMILTTGILLSLAASGMALLSDKSSLSSAGRVMPRMISSALRASFSST